MTDPSINEALLIAETICADPEAAHVDKSFKDLLTRICDPAFPAEIRSQIQAQLIAAGFKPPMPAPVITVSDGLDPFPSESRARLWERLGLIKNRNEDAISNLDNVLRVLEAMPGTFAHYDEFHSKIFSNGKEWSEAATLNLQRYIQGKIGIARMTKETVYDAVASYAWKHRTNEPLDYFSSLTWDGTKRIAGFLHTHLGADDNPYTYAISKNFWIGMAARIYQPGCQLDNMIVLEGGQGIGKTSTLRIIGGKWYVRAHESVLKKDFFITLQGKLLVEIGELDAFKGAKAERIKSVVDTPTDDYRTPYDKANTAHPRRCVFVATTNEKEYLVDPTGARRFWPVLCTKINLTAIQQDRDQLFAEAVHCYHQKQTWHEVPEELAKQEQEERRQGDAWEDLVNDYLIGKSEVRLVDVAVHGLGIQKDRLDQQSQRRISGILRMKKWVNCTVRDGGQVVRKWVAPC